MHWYAVSSIADDEHNILYIIFKTQDRHTQTTMMDPASKWVVLLIKSASFTNNVELSVLDLLHLVY
jgi:hypothetical protein